MYTTKLFKTIAIFKNIALASAAAPSRSVQFWCLASKPTAVDSDVLLVDALDFEHQFPVRCNGLTLRTVRKAGGGIFDPRRYIDIRDILEHFEKFKILKTPLEMIFDPTRPNDSLESHPYDINPPLLQRQKRQTMRKTKTIIKAAEGGAKAEAEAEAEMKNKTITAAATNDVKTTRRAAITSPAKIRLSETRTYPGVVRVAKDGTTTTVDGIIAASSRESDGDRWLSFYDCMVMLTGKTRHAIELKKAQYITNLSKGEVGVETEKVTVKIGSGAWKSTPAIRASDLDKLAVEFNATIRAAAATTHTQVSLGDTRVIETVFANRDAQEILAVLEPDNIMCAVREALDGGALDAAIDAAAATTATLLPDSVRELLPLLATPLPVPTSSTFRSENNVRNDEIVQAREMIAEAKERRSFRKYHDDIMPPSRFTKDDIKDMMRPSRPTDIPKHYVYMIRYTPRFRTRPSFVGEDISAFSEEEAPFGLIEVGVSSRIIERLGEHRSQNPFFKMTVIHAENFGLEAMRAETELKKLLHSAKLLPNGGFVMPLVAAASVAANDDDSSSFSEVTVTGKKEVEIFAPSSGDEVRMAHDAFEVIQHRYGTNLNKLMAAPRSPKLTSEALLDIEKTRIASRERVDIERMKIDPNIFKLIPESERVKYLLEVRKLQ